MMLHIFSKKDEDFGDVYDCDKWGHWDRLDECKRYEKRLVAEAKDLALSILFYVSLVLAVMYMFGWDYTSGVFTAVAMAIWAGLTYYCGGKSMIKRYIDHLGNEATYE